MGLLSKIFRGASPAPFMGALYQFEPHEVASLITRSDVPGLVTCLMARAGRNLRNASPDDLRAAGLTVEAAWNMALAENKRLVRDIEASKVSDDPIVVLLTARNSLAMHSILLCWHDRPEWTRGLGSLVAYIDQMTYLMAPCAHARDVDRGIEALNVAAVAIVASEDDEPAEPDAPGPVLQSMWWADREGLELVELGDGAYHGGPRFSAARQG